jgi:hypothetical protein
MSETAITYPIVNTNEFNCYSTPVPNENCFVAKVDIHKLTRDPLTFKIRVVLLNEEFKDSPSMSISVE